MKISILDLCPVFERQGPAAALRGSIELAGKAEEFGAARYLVAEHHANPASAATAPEVLISAIANDLSAAEAPIPVHILGSSQPVAQLAAELRRVFKLPSSARRAGVAALGCVHRKAEEGVHAVGAPPG
ncbi:hypothetical protein ACFVHI_30290, partial [Kitasatospora sp. NPDC127121]